jgi:hypothetical protein
MSAPANPQPDPRNEKRRAAPERGEASSLAPEEPRHEQMDDEKAAKALEKIEDLRRKLEPRG